MYKGNGNTRLFPLPAGADGTVIWLVAGGRKVRLTEGEAYEVREGSVMLYAAPPVGAEVAFGDEDVLASVVSPAGNTMLILRSDGTMEYVSEDPAVLLAEARELLRQARLTQKAAVEAEEGVRVVAAEQKQLADERLSGRLSRYEGLVEESVKSAALLARDDIRDHTNKLLLEIRNKHKGTVEAYENVKDLLRGAKRELDEMVDEAVERMETKMEPMLEALSEMRDLAFEAREAREAAKNASFAAGGEVMAVFGSQSNVVLEELRSLKSTVSGEVKGAIEGARAAMNAEVEQVRALRDMSVRAAKRCEEIERKALESLG